MYANPQCPKYGAQSSVKTNLQPDDEPQDVSLISLRQGHDDLKVEVHCHSESGSEEAIAFSYIPKYLFYIVRERSLLIMLIIDWCLHVHAWLLSARVDLQKFQTPHRS